MTELPKGWELAAIEDVLATLSDGRLIHQGWSPQCEREPAVDASSWAVLKTTAIQAGAFLDGANKLLPESLDPRPPLEVRAGDLLLTCAGPRARCGVACLVREVRPRLMVSGKMYRFRVDTQNVDPRYVEYALLSPDIVQAIDEIKTGISDSGLNLTHARFRSLRLPLAPRNEQKRIVEAVEEAFSKLDAGETGLRAVRQLLKRTRDAIFAAAVTGRLLPQDSTDTPAAKLLVDLGVEPFNSVPDDLPPTWAKVRLADVISEPLANGRSVRSHPGGFPVLRLTCLRSGCIDLAERKEGEWDAADAAKYLVRRGDFLVSRGNGSLALVGRGGLVDEEPDAVAYPDTLIRVRVPETLLEPSLLAMIWNSAVVRQQLESQARTTAGIYKVNQSMLSEVLLPLPPREEQARLVAEVERQVSFVEACERSVDAGLEVSAALRRSVLKAAFEGRLVTQDPTDEPASDLLERIRAERAANPMPKKRRARATA